MSDNSFFREVDDAVRQDQYKALWDKYGVFILILAAVLIGGVAAYKGWTYWQQRQAQDAGNKFSQALALESGGDAAKASEAFAALAEDGPAGYRVLSRFQVAAAEARAGETEKAVTAYDALASDGSVDPILQGLATLQAATLRLDTADYAEMDRRLKGLIAANSAWRFTARELLGLSAYKNGDRRAAEAQFSALLADPATPPNLRDRANVMLALIVGSAPASSAATN